MYAEVVVNRPIVKRNRRSFVDAPEDAVIPAPELHQESPEPEAPEDDNPLALTFHYHIPPHLADNLRVGHLVAVPFRTQQLMGVVVGLSQISPVSDTRPVEAILDPNPVLTPNQIELARWLSREYIAPLAACLQYFLPPGSGRKPELMLIPLDNTASPGSLTAPERVLLAYLRQKGPTPLAEVDPGAAAGLVEKGLARRQSVLTKPRVGPKLERMVELTIPPDEIDGMLPTLGRPSKQADLLLYLSELDDPLPALDNVLAAVDCSISPVNALVERGWAELIPPQTRLDMPPALRDNSAPLETITDSPAEQKVLGYMRGQGRPMPLVQILEATAVDESTIDDLVEHKRLARFDEPERLTLTLPTNDIVEAVIELRYAHKYADVLRLLALEDGPVWVGWVYAQTEATLNTLKTLEDAGAISMGEARRWRDPLAGRGFTLDTPPKLTAEQQAVWEEVAQTWQSKSVYKLPFLLHGVTGSGKTEIYLRAIAAALQAGQSAIFLVPEITLATQTVDRVSARFPGRVALWHSALSPGERFDTWERVRAGELPIIVGPRSALFAPVKNLGVIIVDEEHEPAYKQRDRSPVFHARDAALELGRLSNALVLMGSATPDVVSYRKAERGEYLLLHLPNRILAHTKHIAVQQNLLKRVKDTARRKKIQASLASGRASEFVSLPLPEVEVVDLREELRAGNRSIFSRSLQAAMRTTLSRGEQVILFLNRRGTASFVICRDCGYVMTCPRCETTLTYHTSGELMVCHYCGYRAKIVEECPRCGSDRIRFFGLGTQRVEEAVKQMFPEAQPIRWDWDSTRTKGSHHVFLDHFMNGRANVMIGTQMVAKGLDLPLVTLVGVISADTALYLPDFRAGERTFQLLMQVAGRAGRSPLGGRVIIQSYTPDQVPIEAASNHDYEGFYQMELAFRREQRYPPFKRLALLLYQGPGQERSAEAARQLAYRLRQHIARQGIPAVEVLGPTPSYVRRIRNQYRWHVLLRAQDPASVLRPLLPLPQGWRVDIDPVTLL
ncbi:MAG: primosomal protein N' [Anaerolineales bacterium]|nr:primosomal protein N' [Anaerolineales bacterium]